MFHYPNGEVVVMWMLLTDLQIRELSMGYRTLAVDH